MGVVVRLAGIGHGSLPWVGLDPVARWAGSSDALYRTVPPHPGAQCAKIKT